MSVLSSVIFIFYNLVYVAKSSKFPPKIRIFGPPNFKKKVQQEPWLWHWKTKVTLTGTSLSKSIWGPTKFWLLKDLWLQKIFGSRKIWVPANYVPENCGTWKIKGPKNLWTRKITGPENFGYRNYYIGSQWLYISKKFKSQILGHEKLGFKRNFQLPKILGRKILDS